MLRRTYAFDASNLKHTEPAEFVEASFDSPAGEQYFIAEPLPESRPMTTESALSPPAEDEPSEGAPSAGPGAALPPPSGSAEAGNEGLNSLRSIPEPSPLNLLTPSAAPMNPRTVRPNTAKSIRPDRNSAQTSPRHNTPSGQSAKQNGLAARTPIRHTMAPATLTTLRRSPSAPSTQSTASTIDPVSSSTTTTPDPDGFLAPNRISTSGVTRVRAR